MYSLFLIVSRKATNHFASPQILEKAGATLYQETEFLIIEDSFIDLYKRQKANIVPFVFYFSTIS